MCVITVEVSDTERLSHARSQVILDCGARCPQSFPCVGLLGFVGVLTPSLLRLGREHKREEGAGWGRQGRWKGTAGSRLTRSGEDMYFFN